MHQTEIKVIMKLKTSRLQCILNKYHTRYNGHMKNNFNLHTNLNLQISAELRGLFVR